MGYRVVAMIVSLCLCSSCAVAAAKKKESVAHSQDLVDVFAQSVGRGRLDAQKMIDEKLAEKNAFGYVAPYVPVMQPPIVKRVWIPEQKTDGQNDVLVSGHWVYLMIEGPKWFIDEENAYGIDH